MTKLKQIIGLGGGGFMGEENFLLDMYIVAQSPKPNPVITFLPTASADNPGLVRLFERTFSQFPCIPQHMDVVYPRVRDMEKFLLDSDIIYVGGGNTKSMLGLWREWGVDKALSEAYDRGVVLAGTSAGFVCWFEQCVTDSFPDTLSAMNCLGLIKGAGCPHYGKERDAAFASLLTNGLIQPGYASENSVGLHFVDGILRRAVTSDITGKTWYVYKDLHNKIVRRPVETEYLGDGANFDKYISPIFEHEQ